MKVRFKQPEPTQEPKKIRVRFKKPETVSYADADKWITVHPNGKGSGGSPVLIGEDGTVKGGMGGKFNGKNIKDAHGTKRFTSGETNQETKERHERESKVEPKPAEAPKKTRVRVRKNNIKEEYDSMTQALRDGGFTEFKSPTGETGYDIDYLNEGLKLINNEQALKDNQHYNMQNMSMQDRKIAVLGWIYREAKKIRYGYYDIPTKKEVDKLIDALEGHDKEYRDNAVNHAKDVLSSFEMPKGYSTELMSRYKEGTLASHRDFVRITGKYDDKMAFKLGKIGAKWDSKPSTYWKHPVMIHGVKQEGKGGWLLPVEHVEKLKKLFE